MRAVSCLSLSLLNAKLIQRFGKHLGLLLRERIAGHLNIPTAEFVETHLEAEEEDGSCKARQKPCPLLGDDDRCTIYDVRPTVCREYPHTDKEGLVFSTMGVANNALTCPAVFWIVEEMKKRSKARRRKKRRRRL